MERNRISNFRAEKSGIRTHNEYKAAIAAFFISLDQSDDKG